MAKGPPAARTLDFIRKPERMIADERLAIPRKSLLDHLLRALRLGCAE